MASDVKIFDPENVDVVYGGVPLSGFAEDTFVTIEAEGDDWLEVDGVDGDLTRSKNLAQKYKVTFHLMSSSRSNAYLSGLRELDLSETGGAGVTSILIRDRNGTSLFVADKAWIMKPPTATSGKTATPREWVCRVKGAKFFEGGVT
jgi:hypothetical protein